MYRLLLFFFLSTQVVAQQDTCIGPYNFMSQADIDANEAELLECSVLKSGIYIDGFISHGRKRSFNSFQAFRNLETIGGYLILSSVILDNGLNGFDNLSSIQRGLVLLEVESEESIGFENSLRIEREISIADCNFKSLEDLKNVKGEIEILDLFENKELVSIEGLQGFESDTTGLSIKIEHNPELKSLSGIENMHIPDLGHVFIAYNQKLSDCATKNICDALINGQDMYFNENAPGCNSKEEVLAQCLTKVTSSKDQPLRIYPNPAQNLLNIEGTNGQNRIQIVDVTGREWINHVKADSKINIEHLPPGMYMLFITTESKTTSATFIKE